MKKQKEPEFVPLYKAMELLGYKPSKGQSIGISMIIRELTGYRLEHMYVPELRSTRAHIDTSIVTPDVLNAVVRRMKVLNRIVPDRPVRVNGFPENPYDSPATPLPDATKEEAPVELVQRSVLRDLLDVFIGNLETALQPDLDPLRKDLHNIAFDASRTLALTEMILTRLDESTGNKPIPEPAKPLPPPKPTPAALADFFEHLAATQPDFLVPYMQLAEYVRDISKPAQPTWTYDLPLDAVWQGKHWVSMSYTDRFLKDYTTLTIEQQRAVRHMLVLLTMNQRHASLHTHRLKYKEDNPPGCDSDAVYSRASDNVRVYWLQTDDDVVEFQRIIVKAG